MNLKIHDQLVYLISEMKPWALALPAQLKLIGLDTAQVQIKPEDFHLEAEDWETMLSIGQKFSLQLNHSFEHLDIPVLETKIETWRLIRESNVLHVHLRILESTSEFHEFLAQI